MSVRNPSIDMAICFHPTEFIREVTRLYDQRLLFTIVASHTMASVLFFFVWTLSPNPTLLGWYLFFSVFSVFRLFGYHYFRGHNDFSIDMASIWFIVLLAASFLSGICWGSVGVLLNNATVYDYSQLKLIHCFLVIMLCGMLAVNTRLNIKQPIIHVLFSLPAVMIYTIFLMTHEGMFLLMLGLLLSGYYCAMVGISYRFDRIIIRKLFANSLSIKPR